MYSYQECRDGGAYTVNKVITIISVSHNVPIYLEQTDIGIYHVLTLPTCIPNKEYPSSRVYYIASTLVSLLGGDMVRVLLQFSNMQTGLSLKEPGHHLFIVGLAIKYFIAIPQ